MTRLFLATNRVNFTDSGHLQIVRERLDGGFEEIEVQADAGIPFNGPWTFTGSGTDPNRDHFTNTPNATVDGFGNLLGNDDYGFIEIDIPEAEIDFAWDILLQAQDQMVQAQNTNPSLFNYEPFYNSNTFVHTLMSVVGIDILGPIPSLGGQSYIDAAAPTNVTGGFTNIPGLPPIFLPPYPGVGRNALKDSQYPNDAIDLFITSNDGNNTINTGWGNDTIIASSGNDAFDGSFGFDTVDYRQMPSNISVNVFITVTGVTVTKSNGAGTDTLTTIEAIFGTAQSDSFIIDSFLPFTGVTINGGSVLPPPGNGEAVSSGGRYLSAAELAAASGASENHDDQDTVTVAQALLDGGAAVTYYSDVGEGIIYLNGVSVGYTGIFHESGQDPDDYFAGLTPGSHASEGIQYRAAA